MKLTLIKLLILSVNFTLLQSQDFAQLGAKWWYLNDFPNFPDNGFLNEEIPIIDMYEVVKDTFLVDRVATVVRKESIFFNGERRFNGEEFFYTQHDSVWIFIEDQFHLLYNFNAQAGDTINVINKPFPGFFSNTECRATNFAYKIDSVGLTLMNGDTLIKQYVSSVAADNIVTADSTEWGFQDIFNASNASGFNGSSGELLQGIGFLGRISPVGHVLWVSFIVGFAPKTLTCYQDSNRNFQFLNIDCDSLLEVITSNRQEIELELGNIFPNPVENVINFIDLPSGEKHVSIYNSQGEIVYNSLEIQTDLSIETSSFISGMYYVIIHFDQKIKTTHKFIKK